MIHTIKKIFYKFSNIRQINRVYEEEATKFVFNYINDAHNELPKAIQKILFTKNTNQRCIRSYDDQSKIKINDKYHKGTIAYSLLDTWNKTDFDTKMAGNVFSLKMMLKNKVNEDIKSCSKKNCYICSIDYGRKYEAYMKK